MPGANIRNWRATQTSIVKDTEIANKRLFEDISLTVRHTSYYSHKCLLINVGKRQEIIYLDQGVP
ncbi:hypothetical protein CHS0354_015641 [Potamilus streckersoni]|uniref:Uncharacterized protein n=1 Tax=Potamilus streckersoni TaxID=2493646 RepID=A0AAE0VUD0_9BIVA|nr:hypothetical protein CHS0354_015641 [Potamilus streckersoni]